MPRYLRTPANALDVLLAGDYDFRVVLPQLQALKAANRGGVHYDPATKRWRVRFDLIPAFGEAIGVSPAQIELEAPLRTDALDALLDGKAPVLDIEIWSPAGASASKEEQRVVAVSWQFWGEDQTHQLCIARPDQEPELLRRVAAALQDCPFAFTYNGEGFDWEVLNLSWQRTGIAYQFPVAERSVDLLPFGFALRDREGLPNAKLKTLEIYYGIDRTDDISGRTVAALADAMLIAADPVRQQTIRRVILRHNAEDVSYLLQMAPRLLRLETSTVPGVQETLTLRAAADQWVQLQGRLAELRSQIETVETALRDRVLSEPLRLPSEEGTVIVDPDGSIRFEPGDGLALLQAQF